MSENQHRIFLHDGQWWIAQIRTFSEDQSRNCHRLGRTTKEILFTCITDLKLLSRTIEVFSSPLNKFKHKAIHVLLDTASEIGYRAEVDENFQTFVRDTLTYHEKERMIHKLDVLQQATEHADTKIKEIASSDVAEQLKIQLINNVLVTMNATNEKIMSEQISSDYYSVIPHRDSDTLYTDSDGVRWALRESVVADSKSGRTQYFANVVCLDDTAVSGDIPLDNIGTYDAMMNTGSIAIDSLLQIVNSQYIDAPVP